MVQQRLANQKMGDRLIDRSIAVVRLWSSGNGGAESVFFFFFCVFAERKGWLVQSTPQPRCCVSYEQGRCVCRSRTTRCSLESLRVPGRLGVPPWEAAPTNERATSHDVQEQSKILVGCAAEHDNCRRWWTPRHRDGLNLTRCGCEGVLVTVLWNKSLVVGP